MKERTLRQTIVDGRRSLSGQRAAGVEGTGEEEAGGAGSVS
jgi:hypothetical protein